MSASIVLKSSKMNALTHGVRARGVLVPGESAKLYGEHAAGWMESLKPRTSGEAQIVRSIADLSWCLQRLARLEQKFAETNLETLLAQLPEQTERPPLVKARTALSSMIDNINAVSIDEVPVTPQLIDGFRGVLRVVDATKLTESRVRAEFDVHLSRMEASPPEEETTRLKELIAAAKRLKNAFTWQLRKLDKRIALRREELRLEALILPEAQSKMLNRYRREIESAMSRELELLREVQKTSDASDRRNSPFGATPEPISVRTLDGKTHQVMPATEGCHTH